MLATLSSMFGGKSTLTQVRVFVQVLVADRNDHAICATQIAMELGLKLPTVSRALKHWEERGWLVRLPHPDDSRLTGWKISELAEDWGEPWRQLMLRLRDML